MSNMKAWLREHGISYGVLASLLGQTPANISNKVNGVTRWQERDLICLHDRYKLSADFVLGLSTTSQVEKEDNLASRCQ